MESEHERLEVYQIVVKGHLDSEWSEWFDGLTITMVDNGATILSGPIVDQTALHGVLIKIRDLGLPLLSLTRIDPDLSDSVHRPSVHTTKGTSGVVAVVPHPTLSCSEEVVEAAQENVLIGLT